MRWTRPRALESRISTARCCPASIVRTRSAARTRSGVSWRARWAPRSRPRAVISSRAIASAGKPTRAEIPADVTVPSMPRSRSLRARRASAIGLLQMFPVQTMRTRLNTVRWRSLAARARCDWAFVSRITPAVEKTTMGQSRVRALRLRASPGSSSATACGKAGRLDDRSDGHWSRLNPVRGAGHRALQRGAEDVTQRLRRDLVVAVRRAAPVAPLDLDVPEAGLYRNPGAQLVGQRRARRFAVRGMAIPVDPPGFSEVESDGARMQRRRQPLDRLHDVIDGLRLAQADSDVLDRAAELEVSVSQRPDLGGRLDAEESDPPQPEDCASREDDQSSQADLGRIGGEREREAPKADGDRVQQQDHLAVR